ncbi:nodulation protein NodH [Thioclava atlantica]|uniref:Nodulation protein NodH n=1 Tax=Thioclava atlantica TaxID=1317124 RepID=A0A085TWL2_9RHOB|nr:nodulation protein NodH [Thioclava atlantica]KFE35109.1 hypothetical protein DW2_09046 [Thioclava atlantica]
MARFDSFVVFAEMRTGSNLLEAALNGIEGVACHGEAFNPVLIGYPQKTELLGISKSERDADPLSLWKAIRKQDGLNGCRYFHDHDPRMLPVFVNDPKCAKIVLTRNPIESYVSLLIARSTGQWKLGDAKSRKSARARFDAAEFETHLEELQGFQVTLLNALQRSGQTAFYLDYEDAQSLDVLNGLAQWLGVEGQLEKLPEGLKVQNPEPLEAKVSNFSGMETSLARLDRFNLSRTPNFEPRRGPGVPGFIAAKEAGLLYMPMRPAMDAPIRDWLARLGDLEEGFSQKTLRQWKRRHPGHRSFTVLRHPLMRAHLAFSAVLNWDNMSETRTVLRKAYKLPIPDEGVAITPEAYPDALIAFLKWLKSNLANQTSLPVNVLWATQSAQLQGLSQFALPDLLVREESLAEDLAYLTRAAGIDAPPFPEFEPDTAPIKLADIWCPELEATARETYTRDVMQFGFGDWKRG